MTMISLYQTEAKSSGDVFIVKWTNQNAICNSHSYDIVIKCVHHENRRLWNQFLFTIFQRMIRLTITSLTNSIDECKYLLVRILVQPKIERVRSTWHDNWYLTDGTYHRYRHVKLRLKMALSYAAKMKVWQARVSWRIHHTPTTLNVDGHAIHIHRLESGA